MRDIYLKRKKPSKRVDYQQAILCGKEIIVDIGKYQK